MFGVQGNSLVQHLSHSCIHTPDQNISLQVTPSLHRLWTLTNLLPTVSISLSPTAPPHSTCTFPGSVLLLKLWRCNISAVAGNVLSQVIPLGKLDDSFQCRVWGLMGRWPWPKKDRDLLNYSEGERTNHSIFSLTLPLSVCAYIYIYNNIMTDLIVPINIDHKHNLPFWHYKEIHIVLDNQTSPL